MTQFGFFFDQTRCAGCRTCQIACKDKNRLPVGVFCRKVRSFETGAFPEPGFYHLSASCCHCEAPACVSACPVGRLVKDGETGLVCCDDEVRCLGKKCLRCVEACPYDHPFFLPARDQSGKCDGCLSLVRRGEEPACVAACMMRALRFGPMDQLKAEYGEDAVTALPCFPNGGTGPNLLILPRKAALEKSFEEKEP